MTMAPNRAVITTVAAAGRARAHRNYSLPQSCFLFRFFHLFSPTLGFAQVVVLFLLFNYCHPAAKHVYFHLQLPRLLSPRKGTVRKVELVFFPRFYSALRPFYGG
ncbi:unnamed protein product [Amoebophrya sp. A120]|nr:unnamed protein product [Amoebophrya sp. A120]|eukprot:GSA120T00019883001.1